MTSHSPFLPPPQQPKPKPTVKPGPLSEAKTPNEKNSTPGPADWRHIPHFHQPTNYPKPKPTVKPGPLSEAKTPNEKKPYTRPC